jgi:tetratricopeptide (TPR) repeat protein
MTMNRQKWLIPLAFISVFIFVFSLRQLSDPDLGFHLKYGKWITEHRQIPDKDQSTYTVPGHDYIDLHWLFQLMLYGIFHLTGYSGISLFFCLLSLGLSLLLLLRNQYFGVSPPVTCLLLFTGYLIIDPRLAPRPEMFSFIFLAAIWFILDLYHERGKNYLFLLPFIMLIWCNMHALFILGLVIIFVFLVSKLLRERKSDPKFIIWACLSMAICLVNPYGINGFFFPVGLLTRFDPQNVYNQHIKEFMPFFSQPRFVIRDYLFLILLLATPVLMVITRRSRKLHEWALVTLFGFLALSSIRNMPLFVLAAFPVLSHSIPDPGRWNGKVFQRGNIAFYSLMIILPVAITFRILTGSWYPENNSFNKSGLGLNPAQLPTGATAFLLNNKLDGRILNSVGYGGWLSWTLPQPVFIDGRLEVMQEPLYEEITRSWKGYLPALVEKYHPNLIIYNYLKYYPWTRQLGNMETWRLIYLDGSAAVFASCDYAPQIPEIDPSKLTSIHEISTENKSLSWLEGFYKSPGYASIDDIHKALFRDQMGRANRRQCEYLKATGYYNRANEKCRHRDFAGALRDYDSAIALKPDYLKAYNNRAIVRAINLKDLEGALSDFSHAIELDSSYADAWLGRGNVWLYLHHPREACSDWQHASQLGNRKAGELLRHYQ